MLNKILFSLLFFFPAGVGNATPVFIAKIPFLKKFNYPLDFNLKFRGKRILGSHKTIRGLLFGVLFAILTMHLEYYLLQEQINKLAPFDYNQANLTILGGLLGLGAIVGDFVKSFFKRRVGIKPGASWIPFDQIDYILGGIIFSLLYIQMPIIYYILIFISYSIIHPISTVIGYYIKLKDSPI